MVTPTFDNKTLIRFLTDNLHVRLRNNKRFQSDIVEHTEQETWARWRITVQKNDISFQCALEFHPEENQILIYPSDNEELRYAFQDQDELLTRIELLYFYYRFHNFYPQELSDATQNKFILEQILKICRFVETKLLEGNLKKCNVMWNERHLMCEFMFEGNFRDVEQNSWFLHLEYYPQIQDLNETYFITSDELGEEEGLEEEVPSLREAMKIIESTLGKLQ